MWPSLENVCEIFTDDVRICLTVASASFSGNTSDLVKDKISSSWPPRRSVLWGDPTIYRGRCPTTAIASASARDICRSIWSGSEKIPETTTAVWRNGSVGNLFPSETMDSAAFSEYFECHSHSVDGVERSKHAAMKRKLEGRREVDKMQSETWPKENIFAFRINYLNSWTREQLELWKKRNFFDAMCNSWRKRLALNGAKKSLLRKEQNAME